MQVSTQFVFPLQAQRELFFNAPYQLECTYFFLSQAEMRIAC